jgi:hypothetical protein
MLEKGSDLKFIEKVSSMISLNKCAFRMAVLTNDSMFVGPYNFRYLKKQATMKDEEY